MPKRGTHRVVLKDWMGKKRDEGAIEIELDDGSTVRIDPPQLWPEEATKAAANDDTSALAMLVLGGPEEFRKFCNSGGNATMIMAIFGEVHGTDPGESSASSTS